MFRFLIFAYVVAVVTSQEVGRQCTRLNCPSNGGCLKQRVNQIQVACDEKDRKIANLTARLEQLEKSDDPYNGDDEVARLTERVEQIEAIVHSIPPKDNTDKDEKIANLTHQLKELESKFRLSQQLLTAQLSQLVQLTDGLLTQLENRTSGKIPDMTQEQNEETIMAMWRFFFDRAYPSVITGLTGVIPVFIETGDYICNQLCRIKQVKEGNLEIHWDKGIFLGDQLECLYEGANVTFKWTGLQNVNRLHIMDLLLCTSLKNKVGQQSGSETFFLSEGRYHFASGVGDNCIHKGIRVTVCAVSKEFKTLTTPDPYSWYNPTSSTPKP